MTDPRNLPDLTLHVFEQDGGWSWALTIERLHGTGKKVVAFSEVTFTSQAEAQASGQQAFDREQEGDLRRLALT
jgi:hypothetical protein